jgi:hypothetical protein
VSGLDHLAQNAGDVNGSFFLSGDPTFGIPGQK